MQAARLFGIYKSMCELKEQEFYLVVGDNEAIYSRFFKENHMMLIVVPTVLLAISIFYGQTNASVCSEILVQTKTGIVEGTRNSSRFGTPYYSFRGIPFAEPPVGDLRFKAPVPATPWDGVRSAKQNANICKQKNYLFSSKPSIEGSEDCLYINVYTPKNPCTKITDAKGLLPVMVFIHYGAFIAGSSHSDLLGPNYLMDREVLLVTFNYRLGIFGFYSTLDDAAPGNWAFKDQVLALKWVQQNIKAFGGDSDRVTIFGQSAGAGSVHNHMLSPSSAGLFQQAICQSGSALAIWARPLNAMQSIIYKVIAQGLNCNDSDNFKIVDCLRKLDSDVVINSADALKYFQIEPLIIFSPVAEVETSLNPEPFMTEDPFAIVQSGNFPKVPWMVGITSSEGILRTSSLIRQAETFEQLNKNFDSLVQQMIGIAASVPENETTKIWNNFRDFYMGAGTIDLKKPNQIEGFTELMGDRVFNYPSYQSALYHSYKGHKNIYFYLFNYRGQFTYGDVFAATTETVDFPWGVSHCDDLLYLFNSPQLFPALKHEKDVRMSKFMVKLWTDFAIYGNPTPKPDTDCKQGWEPLPNLEGVTPLVNEYLHYLNITGSAADDEPIHFEMRNQLFPERMSFMSSLPLHENIGGFQ